LDQSSPLPATAAADPVLEKANAKTKTTPGDSKMLTGSHHINFRIAGNPTGTAARALKTCAMPTFGSNTGFLN
ncbi:MAG: hypothetical protein WB679_13500, partial [Terracidiphilus sp.]